MLKQNDVLSHVIDEHFNDEVVFLQQLVRAKSENLYTPDTSPANVAVEAKVAATIYKQMQQLKWNPALYGVSPQRQNVLCTLPGSSRSGKTLILTAHMDTVPASHAYTRDPWSAEIEQGRLYGVGAADSKAQIAAFLYAVQAVQQTGIPVAGTLQLAFVVDEETGACSPYGTRYLLEQGLLHGDAALVGEPGEHKIAIGHRGLYRFRIRTKGESVHTGIKEWEMQIIGHNAATDMAQIINALFHWSLPDRPSVAFPGRRNILTFPTLIHGGSSVNMVPESCEAYGDIRLLPGIKASEVRETIEQCLAPLGIPYELEEVVFVAAVETSPNASIVQTLAQAATEVTGTCPRIEGAGPTCEGWMFSTRGIETICGYGVNCGGLHGADEWVDLESLRRVTEVYARTIIQYLG